MNNYPAGMGCEHEGDSGIESKNSIGETYVYVWIAVPELNLQKSLRVNPDETAWVFKLQILSSLAKELKDRLNYGLFCPAFNGRAGKFMDEERSLKDYSLPGPVRFLEFRYKRRVYKRMNVDPFKLKQLHNKSTLKKFMDAVYKFDINKITKLTEKGLDPNFQDEESGETPLSIAATLTHPRDVVMALVEGGAIFDFRTKNGLTPMHSAARLGNVDALGILLDLGSGVNYRDDRGLTPLYHAVCYSPSSSCVHLLLFNYATVGITDSAGWTELHQACKAGRVQHVEQLLFYGININQQNFRGNTALHIAAVNNQEECVRILLFRGADHTVKNFACQTAAEAAAIASYANIADVIKSFPPFGVVPIVDLPSFNAKRRARVVPATPALSHVSRNRSTSTKMTYVSSRDSISNSLLENSNPDLYATLRRGYRTSCGRSQQLVISSPGGGGGGRIENRDDQKTPEARTGNKRVEQLRYKPQMSGYDSRSLQSSSSISSRSSMSDDTDSCLWQAKTIANEPECCPRTVILPKTRCGFGFVLRGAKWELPTSNNGPVSKTAVLNFTPTARCPSLQYVDYVEPGSTAARAGLLSGDFILEINGTSVVRASHEFAVQLVQQTVDLLVLSVATVAVSPLSVAIGDGGQFSSAADKSRAISRDELKVSIGKSSSNSFINTSQYGIVPALPSLADNHLDSTITPYGSNNLPNGPASNSAVERSHVVTSSEEGAVYGMPSAISDRHETYGTLTKSLPVRPPKEQQTLTFADATSARDELHHTYVNVAELIRPAAKAEAESSVRCGINGAAEGPSEVGWYQVQRTERPLDVANSAISMARFGENEVLARRRNSSTGDSRSRNQSGDCGGTRSAYQGAANNFSVTVTNISGDDGSDCYDSRCNDSLPLPPPPPPARLDQNRITADGGLVVRSKQSNLVAESGSSPSVPVPVPAPPPPPPPMNSAEMNCEVSQATPEAEQSQPLFAELRRPSVRRLNEVHADAIRRAVAVRREMVESSDMGNVAAVIEKRIQKCRPLQRPVYKGVQSNESGPSGISSTVMPQSSVPSSDAGQTKLNESLNPAGNSSGDFLSTAEQARNEYVKRRVSSVGPGCPVQRSVHQQHSADEGNRGVALVGDQAWKLRRSTSVGIAAETKTTSAASATNSDVIYRRITSDNMVASQAVPAAAAAVSITATAAHKWPPPPPSKLPSWPPSSKLSTLNGSLSSVPESWFRDLCMSESESEMCLGSMSAVSDFSSFDDYQSLVVPPPPPPPDFSRHCFEIDGSRFSISHTSEHTNGGNNNAAPEVSYESPASRPTRGFAHRQQPAAAAVDTDFRAQPVINWTVRDVVRWLESLHLSELCGHFASNAVDGVRLIELGRSDMIALGVTQVSQRLTLKRAIKRLVSSNHQ